MLVSTVQQSESATHTHVCVLSCDQVCETPWTVACQAPPFHGILQARILEWAATSFSGVHIHIPASSGSPSHLRPRRALSRVSSAVQQIPVKSLSRVQLSVTPKTVVCLSPPSMGFPRQEYWSGLPFPSPRDLPDSGTQVSHIAGGFFTSEPPGKPRFSLIIYFIQEVENKYMDAKGERGGQKWEIERDI